MTPPAPHAPAPHAPARYDASGDAARWAALEAAFDAAHGLAGEARARWLADCEARDPALAAEVRALLAADASSGPIDALAGRLAPVGEVLGGGLGGGPDGPLGDPLGGAPGEALGAEPRAADAPPARVGPYVVAGEIGRGGMGAVYRAHDPRLGRDVALKVFAHAADGGAAGAAAAEARLLAEARAASALDHPHICTIYDVGTLGDGRPYLAMAYYAGGTLADRVAAGPLAVADAARVALELADALAGAHAAGIVHRDVKPRNVAFGERGGAKLLDFGVALLRHDGHAAAAGTPAYMAPEQVVGGPVDGRADVWALGVVLYEMLAGRRPFAGADRAALLAAILDDDPAPDVRALRPDVPPALARAVAHALVKAPEERLPSAGALAAAVRAAITPPPVAPRASRSAGRRRRVLIGVLAAAVAGAGAAGAAAWARRAPPAPTGVDALVTRARDRLALNTAEGAEEATTLLGAVLARAPGHAAAHALLARAQLFAAGAGGARAGQHVWVDSAAAHARRAVALAPDRPDGYAALGDVLANAERPADAVAAYRRALDADPRHAPAMMGLAMGYGRLDRPDESFVWMERAVATDPMLPGARAAAVRAYRGWGLLDEGRAHVAAGLRLIPTDGDLLWEAVQLEALVGDTAAARRLMARRLALLSEAEQLRMRAWFAYLLDDMPAARRWVDRAAGTMHAASDRRMFGEVYLRTGARARGEQLLRAEMARAQAADRRTGGTSRNAASSLAILHAALGAREAALAAFARWVALGGWAPPRVVGRAYGWTVLGGDPRFRAAVARAEARRAADVARVRAALAGAGR